MLVVILTVRPEAIDSFHAFEQGAARVMARHGGTIERAIAVRPDQNGAPYREVHLVFFPSPEAFAAYRADPALAELAALRETSVLDTQVLVGEEGPRYGASPSPGP